VSIADSFATEEIERRLAMVGATLCVTCDASLRAGKTIPLYSKVAAARLGRGGYVVCLRAATTERTAPLNLQRRDVAFDDWLEVWRQCGFTERGRNIEVPRRTWNLST
jgi:acyl-coenzyme A synthetase/AMP-(fatty) acid ligase